MQQWLLNRLFESTDQAKPTFALQGTINWMRALSEVVNSDELSDEITNDIFKKVHRRPKNQEADTLVFQNMLMAHHNLATLDSLDKHVSHKYDVIRSAIVAWYYSTYFAASAMIAASSGSQQDNHTATAKVWHSDFAEKGLLPYPFNLCLSTLVGKDVESQIKVMRAGNRHDLNVYASNIDEARGACLSYLNGTAKYKKWEIEERVKASSDFKILGVHNFRTKAAQKLRDSALSKGQVNYLFQAFRYRGKANYRDSIFLSYGTSDEAKMALFVSDLNDVTSAFIRMASIYCQKRVVKGDWELFISDLEKNSLLTLPFNMMKI